MGVKAAKWGKNELLRCTRLDLTHFIGGQCWRGHRDGFDDCLSIKRC